MAKAIINQYATGTGAFIDKTLTDKMIAAYPLRPNAFEIDAMLLKEYINEGVDSTRIRIIMAMDDSELTLVIVCYDAAGNPKYHIDVPTGKEQVFQHINPISKIVEIEETITAAAL